MKPFFREQHINIVYRFTLQSFWYICKKPYISVIFQGSPDPLSPLWVRLCIHCYHFDAYLIDSSYFLHFKHVCNLFFFNRIRNIYLNGRFTLCMLGNFSLLTFLKLNFKNIWEHYQKSNSLDQDQERYCVGPDLGPNCLKILSAED